MDTKEFIDARLEMGLTRFELAHALGLRSDDAVNSIERGGRITGPMSLAMQKLLGDKRAERKVKDSD